MTGTPDPDAELTASERAVRAALRISARNGCALTRTAAEQVAEAVLGCAGWETPAREAGWLPPDEIGLRVWRARNMNGDSCRWCGAKRAWGTRGTSWVKRDPAPEPHRPRCRFYDGPVTHAAAGGHYGSFDYWISCTCGASYPEHDAEGNKQECPDRELTWRHPKAPDLLVPVLAEAAATTGGGQ